MVASAADRSDGSAHPPSMSYRTAGAAGLLVRGDGHAGVRVMAITVVELQDHSRRGAGGDRVSIDLITLRGGRAVPV
jgi:hypothetical protein